MEGPTESQVIPDAPSRRRTLLASMEQLGKEDKHCGNCSGVCCTFLANSMQITPVEALDLKHWLQEQGRWNPDLMSSLKDCSKKFRLDQDLGDGRRSLRRTYTCPFYRPGRLGCSISPEHKPYGCLAFNARSPGITNGGDCASDLGLLQSRTNTEEDHQNKYLRNKWGVNMEKAPIPVALLAIPED